jgi:hypothetical protein
MFILKYVDATWLLFTQNRTQIPRGFIPRKDEIIEAGHGAWWLSYLDLMSGFFYQLLLKEDDRPLTAFCTPMGQFELIVTAKVELKGFCG